MNRSAIAAVAAIALSLLLAAPPAFALSEKGEGILRVLDFYKGQVDLKKRPFADGASDFEMGQELGPLERKLQSTREEFARMPAEDRADPKYLAADKWVKEFETTLKKWQAERAAMAGQQKVEGQGKEAFQSAVRENESALDFVKSARGTYDYSLDAEEMLAKWKASERLDVFAAKCGKEFALLDATDWAEEKAMRCKDAAEWRSVLGTFFEARSRDNMKRVARELTSDLERIREGSNINGPRLAALQKPADHVAGLRPPYDALFKATGRPLPTDLFTPVTEAATGLPSAIAAAQGKVTYKAEKSSDAGVSKSVRSELENVGIKVLKISQQGTDWRIIKNPIGIPTHRARDSWVLAQKGGEELCRLYDISVTQQYAGGGKYTSNTVVEFGPRSEFAIASCK